MAEVSFLKLPDLLVIDEMTSLVGQMEGDDAALDRYSEIIGMLPAMAEQMAKFGRLLSPFGHVADSRGVEYPLHIWGEDPFVVLAQGPAGPDGCELLVAMAGLKGARVAAEFYSAVRNEVLSRFALYGWSVN